MKILYFDCFSGISGDMAVGALLDAGADEKTLLEGLKQLKADDCSIKIGKKLKNGISGTDFSILLEDRVVNRHVHRNLGDIEDIINGCGLNERVRKLSIKIFRLIAEAEGKIHGAPIEEVHFHEVGAVDSIVDIVGTAICLEMLSADKIYSSELHDGKGFIECRHGMIPVPVPAVMEMLAGSGIPLASEEVETELVTPTGMGLIKCMAAGFGRRPAMTVEKTGYGFGKRNTGRLNALRVILGKTTEGRHEYSDEIAVLETNIDDTTPEVLGYTMSKLLEAGALDAFYTPAFMKKNRPAYMLSVIASPGMEDALADIILRETTTLGIRKRYMQRYCMDRKAVGVNTQYGPAKVKIASMNGIRKSSPEYEDCRKIAEKAGIPLMEAFELVNAEAARQYGL